MARIQSAMPNVRRFTWQIIQKSCGYLGARKSLGIPALMRVRPSPTVSGLQAYLHVAVLYTSFLDMANLGLEGLKAYDPVMKVSYNPLHQ